MIRKVFWLAAAALWAAFFVPGAWAQSSVLQAGSPTAGQMPIYMFGSFGQAIITAAGPAAGGGLGLGLNEFLQVNQGASLSSVPPFAATGSGPLGTHNCSYSGPLTGTAALGEFYLCLDADIAGGPAIAVGSTGTLPWTGLQIYVQGTPYPFPGSGAGDVLGPPSSVDTDLPIFNGTTGTLLKDSGVPISNVGTTVPTNAALAAACTSAVGCPAGHLVFTGPVQRADFSVGLGAPPLNYHAANACPWSSGNDNGACTASSNSTVWVADFPPTGADIREWGATPGGSTDANAAIVAAAAYSIASGAPIVVPSAIFRSSAALAFGAAIVRGGAAITPTNAPIGPTILCDATVTTTCATFGVSGATSAGGNAENLLVGFSGTPTGTATAVVFQGNNSHCNNLMAYNAVNGFEWENGISAHCNNLYTWNLTGRHIIDNGFPELYINNARFGLNGAGDQATSTAFVGITGNNPNGIFCTDCQFNLGSQSPDYLIDYFGVTSQTDGIISLDNDVVDMSVGNGVALVHSDGTVAPFRFTLANTTINAPSLPVFMLGAAPAMQQVSIHDDFLFVSALTMPSVQYDAFNLSNLYVSGTLSINGSSNSLATVSNVEAAGAVTVGGGSWSELNIVGLSSKTSLTNTATGNVSLMTGASLSTPLLVGGALIAGATVNEGSSISAGINADLVGQSAFQSFSTSGTSAGTYFSYSRSATVGAQGAVQNNDWLMRLDAVGSDGAVYRDSADIFAKVDGTVSSGIVPGRIEFYTTNTSGTSTRAGYFDSAQLFHALGAAAISGSTPTVGAGQLGVGATTVAAGSGTCPSGTIGGQTVAGCLTINVAGTARNVPFF